MNLSATICPCLLIRLSDPKCSQFIYILSGNLVLGKGMPFAISDEQRQISRNLCIGNVNIWPF